MRCVLGFFVVVALCVGLVSGAGYRWERVSTIPSSVHANLRVVFAVDASVVWIGGANATVLLTTDGGATWQVSNIAGATLLGIRSLWAANATHAYAMTASPPGGQNARIYATNDGGRSWILRLMNPDAPAGFFDCMSFWNAREGVVLGDPLTENGRFVMYVTRDGAMSWKPVPAGALPTVTPGEGAFAGSGTSVRAYGGDGRHLVFVTGGGAKSRAIRTLDGGSSWNAQPIPIIAGSQATGAYSVAFTADAKRGVVVGGDWTQPTSTAGGVAAWTNDEGATWHEVSANSTTGGYRTCVEVIDMSIDGVPVFLATGPSGSDVSTDGGLNWSPMDRTFNFNAMNFAFVRQPNLPRVGWAIGPDGLVASFRSD